MSAVVDRLEQLVTDVETKAQTEVVKIRNVVTAVEDLVTVVERDIPEAVAIVEKVEPIVQEILAFVHTGIGKDFPPQPAPAPEPILAPPQP